MSIPTRMNLIDAQVVNSCNENHLKELSISLFCFQTTGRHSH